MNVVRMLRVAGRQHRIAVAAAALVVVGSTGGVLIALADMNTADASRPAVRQPALAGEVLAPPPQTPGAGAPAAGAAASTDPDTAGRATDPPAAEATATRPPTQRVLDYQYQEQSTYYYCGPAATRIALTTSGVRASQDDLAARLNTTEAGTDSAEDTTRVLNALTGADAYRTQPMDVVTPARMDRLQADVVRAVTDGRAVVANIAGSVTDTAGRWYSFPGGHYVTVVGYRDDGRTVKIADPANASASSYWLTTIDLANWMAGHGYSA